jgi:hypothetical protein
MIIQGQRGENLIKSMEDKQWIEEDNSGQRQLKQLWGGSCLQETTAFPILSLKKALEWKALDAQGSCGQNWEADSFHSVIHLADYTSTSLWVYT